MKKVRITAIRKIEHRDLMERYENPIEHACDVEEGQSKAGVGFNLGEYCGDAVFKNLLDALGHTDLAHDGVSDDDDGTCGEEIIKLIDIVRTANDAGRQTELEIHFDSS